MLFPSRAPFPPPAPANDSDPMVRWNGGARRQAREDWPSTGGALLPFAVMVLALLATGFRF
jgi:hypothetical protein